MRDHRRCTPAQASRKPVSAPQAPPSPQLVLSVAEAAALLGISKDLVYDLVARGELPSLRLGRRIVVPRRALIAFLGGD
jgi:excisionase family DNA binding protein